MASTNRTVHRGLRRPPSYSGLDSVGQNNIPISIVAHSVAGASYSVKLLVIHSEEKSIQHPPTKRRSQLRSTSDNELLRYAGTGNIVFY